MFRQILVPLDGSPLAEQAVGRAIALACNAHAEIELTLVHQLFPFDGFADAPWVSQLWEAERDYLEAVDDEVNADGDLKSSHSLLRGDPVDMICKRIADIRADLVVMTTHARTGLNRAWLGSVADGIVRHAPVPVLALRPVEGESRRFGSRHLFERILVPVDGSAGSHEIFGPATALARCGDARLTLLRVIEPVPLVSMEVGLPSAYMPALLSDPTTRRLADEAREELVETARRLQLEHGLTVDAHVIVEPRVGQAIIDFANDHDTDLVAMATHGRGVSRLLMGSVADKVMRGGTLPVLLYRPAKIGHDGHGASSMEASALSSAFSSG